MTFGQIELLFDDFNVVLEFLLDGQVKEVLPDVLLIGYFGGEFEHMAVLIVDFCLSQVVFFRGSIRLEFQAALVHFLLVEDQLRIAVLLAAGIYDFDIISFIHNNLLVELPLAIADLKGVPEQKSAYFFRRLELHVPDFVGGVGQSVGIVSELPAVFLLFGRLIFFPYKLALHFHSNQMYVGLFSLSSH